MAQQIQCSNCRGYKITTPASGDVSQHPDVAVMYFFVGGFLTLVGLIALFPLGELLWGVFMLVVGVLILVMANGAHKDYNNYSRTHHECLICGQKWETPD